ncbi:MAG: Hpt domain-containing protein [Lachnospiraceae bacterium]|nr:Hpt domain-containing protein [Lachnospiraceae bacterium]
MLTIKQLESFGVNTKEGLERCLNDESFYLGLIPSALDQSSYSALEQAIKANDMDAAFEAAHALKGVLGNLALTPIYEPVSEMTELLRSRAQADYDSLLKKVYKSRDALAAML